MKISIVIPTLNRPVELSNTVADLLRQSHDDFEILVIDQSEETIAMKNKAAMQMEKLVYFWQEEKSASLARNRGLQLATGEITLFIDDDVIIQNTEFLSAHAKAYSNSELSGVAGAILNPGDSFRHKRHWLSTNLHYGWLFFPINYSAPCSIRNGWAGNLSVRTSFARTIGGMDERYAKGAFREESDFCTRLCNRYGPMEFSPAAWLVHIGSSSGGLRSFRQSGSIRGQHHFDGFFYYTLRLVPGRYQWAHFLSFFRIFFPSRKIFSPGFIIQFLKRVTRGYRNAKSMIESGPIYLSVDENNSLR